MSTTLHPLRPASGPRRDWIGLGVSTLLIVAAGIVVGMQYVTPDKRVLAVLVAGLVFGVAWRLDMVSGIGVMILALPYPRGTVFGNTNLALILLLLIIWLLRTSLRQGVRPHRTETDVPIVGLLIMYIVSFYNISNPKHLPPALANVLLFVACLAIYYLIVNNLREPKDLMRLHLFQTISIATVGLIALYELAHPGGVLIPGWISFIGRDTAEINVHRARVGGPFFDFELMCEYCALNLLLLLFLFLRARSGARRMVYAGLILLMTFVMFATVTRGAVMALGIGLVYLAWIMRRRVKFVPLTLVVVGLVLGLQVMNYYVATFTKAGSLLQRLGGTRFVGLVPDSRVGAWGQAFDRMMMHPLIGHGPHYAVERGLAYWFFPHCLYLYIPNLVGLIGLAFFLALMWKLWRLSRPIQVDLRGGSYAQAFLVIAHVQLFVFLVDQVKIEYLRNTIYQFQVWVMLASIAATHQIVQRERAGSAPVRPL